MADTTTTNFNLVKPEISGSPSTWGNKLNNNMDTIDANLKVVKDDATASVKRAGDTLTGQLKAPADPVAPEDLARKGYIDNKTNEPISRVGSYRDFAFANAAVTLDAQAFGCYVSLGIAADVTILLPKSDSFMPLPGPAASGEMGGKIHIGNESPTYKLTVLIQDDDFIYASYAGLGITNDRIVLNPGEDAIFLNRGTKEWNVTGGAWRKRIMDPTEATLANIWAGTAKKFVSAEMLRNSQAIVTIPYAATLNLDFNTFGNGIVDLTGNVTIPNPTNVKSGDSGFLALRQPAAGGKTWALGTSWAFEYDQVPALSTEANVTDILYWQVIVGGATPYIHSILAKKVQ